MSFGQLSADDYQVYLPNQIEPGNINTEIFDIYGNQLDGENVGNQTSQTNTGPGTEFPDSSVNVPIYEDLQSSGTYRMDDMSGDGIAGGAFMAAFTVVNYGNVVFAQPGYVENPLNPSTYSNGSLANPYPVLAPEGDPNTAPTNPNHLPNGGLNSSTFWTPGNFNTAYDFSGDGMFEQSALYAASQLSFAEPGNTQLGFQQLGGPVVVVALPGIPQRNPLTGEITQASFVLQAPAGNNSGVTDGSTSVPFNTTLVFDAGSTLKLENASLFVQNQGSALQSDGTASDPVTFTSYNNAAVGGATNSNPDTNPQPGDWGGIVFRNYDQAAQPTVSFPVDGTLTGLNGADALSGALPLMSSLNFFNISYGGGAVPEGSSTFYSAITLYGSAPTISNATISDTGGTGGTEAAIGADLDSFLADDATPDGPVIRQLTVQNNSLNALWLISEANGFIEPTNSMPNIPVNPSSLGGSENYNFFEPLPFAVLAQLVVGQELLENTGGDIAWIPDRLYIEPGVMIKFAQGSALDVLNPASSLNVGSRSYISGFDQNNGYNPLSTGFVAESASDPNVLFTSIYDDDATTSIVPAINVTNETAAQMTDRLIPAPGAASASRAAPSPLLTRPLSSMVAAKSTHKTSPYRRNRCWRSSPTTPTSISPTPRLDDLGTHVYITNNNFFHNFDSAMQIEPNGLLSGNPLTPLESGNPFLRGNVMSNNGIDALMVLTLQSYYFATPNYTHTSGPSRLSPPATDTPIFPSTRSGT